MGRKEIAKKMKNEKKNEQLAKEKMENEKKRKLK